MMGFDVSPPKPKAGEVWHAQMPGQIELWTVEVVQSTTYTIQVRTVTDGFGTFRPVRYEQGVIKFIEKVR